MNTTWLGHWHALVCAALVLGPSMGRAASSAPPPAVADLATALSLAGDRVEGFIARAQSLICTEVVSMTPLNSGLTSDGFARTVESELRLSWDPDNGGPATETQTRRQVLKVNGRPPRKDDRNNCTTPEQQETEEQPLAMLLPQQRHEYAFTLAGLGNVDGHAAVMIDFRELAQARVDIQAVDGKEDCVRYDVDGGLRGRLWIDRQTSDVLRLEQRLTGMVDMRLPQSLIRRPGVSPVWTLERADTSIRFGRVAFADPEETLVLPLTSSSMRITRGSGTPRLRTVTKYSSYKRFLTGGRLVGDEADTASPSTKLQ